MLVYVFPGQGSQKKGMGADLFDQVDAFTAAEKDIDAVLGYSIRELCLDDPNGVLNQTQYTQPALFVTNALHYYSQISGGEKPDYLAGHSLGEYNALLAAGAIDLVSGIKLVKKRGELMAQAKDGGMAAVIGLDESSIRQVLDDKGLGSIDVANFNSPQQIVVSGPVADIKKAKDGFDQAGAKMCVILPVSAAFHSRYMESAAQEFDQFLQAIEFKPLNTPVIANVSAEPYPEAASSDDIRSLLVKQIHQSVRWTDSIRWIKAKDADADFVEVGPGKVLARLVKQIV